MGEETPHQAVHCGHSVAACPRVLRPIHRHPPLWQDQRPHSAPRPTHEPHHSSEDQPRVAPLHRLAVPGATFPDSSLSTLQHRPSHADSPSGPEARHGNPPLRLSDRLVPIARDESFPSLPTSRRSRLAQRGRAPRSKDHPNVNAATRKAQEWVSRLVWSWQVVSPYHFRVTFGLEDAAKLTILTVSTVILQQCDEGSRTLSTCLASH